MALVSARGRATALAGWTVQISRRDFREASSSPSQKWLRTVQHVHSLDCQPFAVRLRFKQLPITAVAQPRQVVLRGHARPLPDSADNGTGLPWRFPAGLRVKFAPAAQSSALSSCALRAAQQQQNVVEAVSQHVCSTASISTLTPQRSRHARYAMHATMAPDCGRLHCHP